MNDPLTRLVELTVYAPIGLAVVARERLPEYVEEGRTRVEQRLTLARFIGRMVVTQGRREIERRLAEQSPPSGSTTGTSMVRGATSTDEPAPAPPGETEPATAETEVEPATAAPATIEPATTETEVGPLTVPTAAGLPIDEYESLAAAQVVARLADLDADALVLVETFERAHRNRRTVLNRIDQLRGPT